VTDGEPETAVSASLQKIKSIKNQYKLFIFYFLFLLNLRIVNHFNGHFAYLKTMDFSFKHHVYLLFGLISNYKGNIHFAGQTSCVLGTG